MANTMYLDKDICVSVISLICMYIIFPNVVNGIKKTVEELSYSCFSLFVFFIVA